MVNVIGLLEQDGGNLEFNIFLSGQIRIESEFVQV